VGQFRNLTFAYTVVYCTWAGSDASSDSDPGNRTVSCVSPGTPGVPVKTFPVGYGVMKNPKPPQS
jgi:hypothetical protein